MSLKNEGPALWQESCWQKYQNIYQCNNSLSLRSEVLQEKGHLPGAWIPDAASPGNFCKNPAQTSSALPSVFEVWKGKKKNKKKKLIHITKTFMVIYIPSILLSVPVALTHYSHKHKKKWKYFMCLIISTHNYYTRINGNILCVSLFRHITPKDSSISEFCTGEIASKNVDSLKHSSPR